MYYRLKAPYAFRGWKKLPYAIRAEQGKEMFDPPAFFTREDYHYLLYFNGEEDVNPDSFPDSVRSLTSFMLENNIAEVSETPLSPLEPWQRYTVYPSAFIHKVQWAITGICNMSCRHCLVSAPDHHQQRLSFEDLVHIADEIAACGVKTVDITGGEPLTRNDFEELIKILCEKELRIGVIFTNGILLNEQVVNTIEDCCSYKPAFQLSFDGLGHHDWLRGVTGAEEKTIKAFRLLSDRGFDVGAAMMLHKENKDSLRVTANYLASLGVKKVRVNAPQDLGVWKQYSEDYSLSEEEIWNIYREYIPQYFEDGMPIEVDLDGYFSCKKGSTEYELPMDKRVAPSEKLEQSFYCSEMHSNMHIRPDGRIVPCMGLSDTVWGDRMPSLLEEHLWDISQEPSYRKLADTNLAEFLEKNPECGKCEHWKKCGGGCLVQDISENGDYLVPDKRRCWFFKNIGIEAVKIIADAAIDRYINTK
jgi:radical SAM protein with 4Fe4S-binding SPASM domain